MEPADEHNYATPADSCQAVWRDADAHGDDCRERRRYAKDDCKAKQIGG